MKKEVVLGFSLAFLLLLFPIISADSISEQMQRVSHYAEEYETGNLNYVQLLVYLGSVRENLNELLGATGREFGGILQEEQIKQVLGEPERYSRWVWVEGENHDMKLDQAVPEWRKIIFDGKKIQIRLSAYPSAFNKTGELLVFYRFNFEIGFKKPEEQLDIQGKIDEIKVLAENFNSDPSQQNAEALARESVNAEKIFQSHFVELGGMCLDDMKDIFGTENQRDAQKTIVQEIDFYSGDNFEAMMRLELCDECEWNWINLDMWVDTREKFQMPKDAGAEVDRERYKDMTFEEFETETIEIIDKMKIAFGEKDFSQALSYKNELWAVTEVWNQKANDVWREVDEIMRAEEERVRSTYEGKGDHQTDWREFEKMRKEKESELREKNYQERKDFYMGIFAGYEKREYFFEQINFEKRLVEEFKEFGEEICSNLGDDNNNGLVDCADSQCTGKICGETKVSVVRDNQTFEETRDMYCISQVCQLPEEKIEIVTEETVCGNHVCELGEQESCREDCTTCPSYPPIECSGNVVFSGRDEQGCNLEPVCITEERACTNDAECLQPLCGISQCIGGTCQTTGLTECQEAECVDGQERIQQCASGEEIKTGICSNGIWRETGIQCSGEVSGEERVEEEVSFSNECISAADCGGANDVCSNGRCVTLPETIPTGEEQEERMEESPQEITEEEGSEGAGEAEETGGGAPEITGEVILGFFSSIGKNFMILFTGKTIEEGQEPASTETTTETTTPGEIINGEMSPGEIGEPIPPPAPFCTSDSECNDNDECTNDFCANGECRSEWNNQCEEEMQREERPEGEERPKEEIHLEEKGVFTVGGVCRESQQRKEAFIWFGGWGDPFEEIQPLKQKYYSGGEAEWCKWDMENIAKTRKEIEKGFNQEFAAWFFEDYLANNAEDWEQQVSGIFEIYWRIVDNQMETARRMKCLELKEIPYDYNLISFKYESPYGSIEYWEELKTAKLPELDEEVILISPYMKIWIFPPEEFIKYEMRKAMENHEFPGPPEEKMEREREEGLTKEEKEFLRQDENFMENIGEITQKYGEDMNGVIQFKDFETGEVAFNVYIRVSSENILEIEPMLPEEVPGEDVRVEVSFEEIYDLIYSVEKDMRDNHIESPPWDRRPKPVQKVKEVVDGVKMYFKTRDIMNSARIYPQDAEKEGKFLLKIFFKIIMGGEEGPPPGEEEGEDKAPESWEDKEVITGEIIKKI